MVIRGPPLEQRPRPGPALHPARGRLKASKGPGVDPARMHTAPMASWLRVFTEPPARFLGLLSPPLPISWQVPVGQAGNLCPVISQKTMRRAPLDRRLSGKNNLCLKEPDTRSGPARRLGRGEAYGWCRLWPSLSAAHPQRPDTVPARKQPWSRERDEPPPPWAPRDLPQVLHLRGHFAKGRGVVNQ